MDFFIIFQIFWDGCRVHHICKNSLVTVKCTALAQNETLIVLSLNLTYFD